MIQLLTFDMVPAEYRWTCSQERAFLQESSDRYGVPVDCLRRMFAVELPDHPLAWAYQAAYVDAAQCRDDLVPPAVTALDLWQGRHDQLQQSLSLLRDGRPPAVVFLSIAVLERG